MKTPTNIVLYIIILFGSMPTFLLAQWKESLNTAEIIHYSNAMHYNDKYIFCNTYKNIYRSSDEGLNWDLILDTGEPHYAYVDNMFVQNEKIWAVGDWNLGVYLIEYSANNGDSWTSLTNNGYPKSCIINHHDVLFMGCPYYPPGNLSTIFRSFDNGTTWEQLVNNGLPEKKGEAKQLIEYKGRLFAYYSESLGVYTSNDLGNSWVSCENAASIENASFERFSITPLGLMLVYKNQNNYAQKEVFLTNNGMTWTKPEFNANNNPSVFAGNDIYWFTNNAEGVAQFSTNKGENWYNWSDLEYTLNPAITEIKPTWFFVLKKTVFAIFGNDLYRRDLNEVIIPEIPAPTEIELTGNPALDKLLEQFGATTIDELPLDVLSSFLDNYEDINLWSAPFFGGQTGTCSAMGMPLWSVDAVSAQLHIQDRIFQSKSIGPSIELDIFFARNMDKRVSTLNKYWSFGYDAEIQISDNAVSIMALPHGKKTFAIESPLTGSIEIADQMQPGNTLQYNGSDWLYTSLRERLTYRYSYFSPSIYLLSQIVDFDNNSLQISRNTDGKISQITDAAGRVILFKYADGNCIGFILPDGRSSTFNYTSNNMLEETIDLANLSSVYTYTIDNDISSINIEGKLVQFNYQKVQGFQRVKQVIEANEDPINVSFEYVNEKETLFKIEAGGTEKKYYSSNGVTTRVQNAQGKTASRVLDSNQRVQGISNSNGSEKELLYNETGDITQIISNQKVLFTYTWDDKKNITSKTNALGNTWFYIYDNKNRLIEVLSPENTKTEMTYYTNGKLKSLKINTLLEQYEYDNFGNLITLTNANGGKTRYTYDSYGYNLLTQTSPLGHKTTYKYDNNSRLIAIEHPDGTETSYTYDCCAQIAKTDENNNTLLIGRNNKHLITNITNAAGDTQNWTFNEQGRPVHYTNTLGYTRSYDYNLANLMRESIDEMGNTTRYFYDLNDQLIRVQDAKKAQTTYMRNSTGELMGIVYNSQDTVFYNRDAINQITSIRNARKQSISMGYDKDGKVLQRVTPEETQTFDWDNQTGLLVGYSNLARATSYQRNASGMISTINYSHNVSLGIQHDVDGNIMQYSYPGDFIVTNEFDSRGRIKSISWGDKEIKLNYDNAGNLTKEIRSENNETVYSYSATNLVQSIDHRIKSTSIVDYQLTRDSEGNILSTNSSPAIAPKKGVDGWSDYAYIGGNQLISNLKSEGGTETYLQHDKDGNCTKIIGQLDLEANYSSLNQLEKLKIGDKTIELKYDAMGNVASLKKDNQTKLFFYDHKNRLMFETDDIGNPLRFYIYKGNRLMAFVENGISYFMQYDYNGNTIMITDDLGVVYNTYFYSAFGEVLAKEERISNLHTFSGAHGVFDVADGYYLMRSRVYQATNARFLQRDPLNYQGDINAYRYASNNPITGFDPLGLETINASSLDASYDYDAGVAGGTADAFNPNLKHSANSGTDPIDILSKLYQGVTDSPLGDLVPGNLGKIISAQKAAKKASDGKGFIEIAWQFVPFNNTMQFVYEEKKKDIEKRAYNYYHLPDGREKLVEKPFSSCSIW